VIIRRVEVGLTKKLYGVLAIVQIISRSYAIYHCQHAHKTHLTSTELPTFDTGEIKHTARTRLSFPTKIAVLKVQIVTTAERRRTSLRAYSNTALKMTNSYTIQRKKPSRCALKSLFYTRNSLQIPQGTTAQRRRPSTSLYVFASTFISSTQSID
jgi:hypothetical protein